MTKQRTFITKNLILFSICLIPLSIPHYSLLSISIPSILSLHLNLSSNKMVKIYLLKIILRKRKNCLNKKTSLNVNLEISDSVIKKWIRRSINSPPMKLKNLVLKSLNCKFIGMNNKYSSNDNWMRKKSRKVSTILEISLLKTYSSTRQ